MTNIKLPTLKMATNQNSQSIFQKKEINTKKGHVASHKTSQKG